MAQEEAQITNRMDFQSYKKLTPDEREYFMFDTLCRIDSRTVALDERFAAKWTEKVMKNGLAVTLLGVLAAVLAQVGIHIHGGN